ncbi:MAG: nucleotide sugar dehydrogenase [Candidatus Xenobia bacterium]
MGYVGFPLAMAFCSEGFPVYGLEESEERLEHLRGGRDYITGNDALLQSSLKGDRFEPTRNPDVLRDADVMIICVPTPLNKNREPDTTFIETAARTIAPRLAPGRLVVLESTTWPGTTEELLIPILESTGLKAGEDFFVAFSPERVDPGNEKFQLRNTPKVVGGLTTECTELASMLYGAVVDTVVRASTPRAAEMEKLLENIYRCANIALINELSMLAKRMDIDIWEVVQLASTKPYGFTPFLPGPGLGGHCIPVDPFYLSWKAREYGFTTRFIELAGEINEQMGGYVVDLITEALGHDHKSLRGSRILILGLAYKSNVADWRKSPALKIIQLLNARLAHVDYHDDLIPFVPAEELDQPMQSVSLEHVEDYDCVVMVTCHSHLPIDLVAERARLIVDTRNSFAGIRHERVWKL